MTTIREADIKRAVDDYLQYGANQGKWVFFRLNAGEFFIEGKTRRRIKGCMKGTSDFLVVQADRLHAHAYDFPIASPVFIEVKSPSGKQSKDQIIFQGLVEAQGAEYHLVRSVDELQKIL